ncbi:MAG: CotH kinase family protein [Clostridia bacterium]|nr:CotH kinase family protein [Clostridia bacterium]
MKKSKKKWIIIVCILILIAIATITLICINNNSQEIPRVYIEGNIANMLDKKDERVVKIKYKDKNNKFESYAQIKIQGDSSLEYAKKNYTIKLYQDENCEEKNKVIVNEAWGEQNKYCLKANWIDKTHSRNIVTARLAAAIQEKYGLLMDAPNNGTIDGFPVEVYINNEFLGLYTWNIPKDEWLWNLDDENSNNIAVESGNLSKTTSFLEEATEFEENGWQCQVGEENDVTLEKLNRLIRFVKDSSDEEFKRDYELYINKDSMLNYLAVLLTTNAVDNICKNLILVTYDSYVWYPTLYDLDTTFGTDSKGEKLRITINVVEEINRNLLFKRTMECFPNEVADRYFELREGILSKENIMKEFESFKEQIPEESLKKENERWSNIPGQDLTQISDYLNNQLTKIDKRMEEKYIID